MDYDIDQDFENSYEQANMVMVGVGEGGCKAVVTIAKDYGMPGLRPVLADKHVALSALRFAKAERIDLDVEWREDYKRCLQGASYAFILVKLGGEHEINAVKKMAEVTSDMNVPFVIFTRMPSKRLIGATEAKAAEDTLESLKGLANASVVIPDDTLFQTISGKLDVKTAYENATKDANKNLPADAAMLVDGAKGAVKIKPISTFTVGFVLVIITLIIVLNLVNSRAGRAIQATRDNRIAAESMGVSVTKYKMMAFVTAAVLAGMAGALYGLNSSTVVPTQFTFNQSINVLVFVVLGGLGNVLGSIISATFLTVLPEVLREFADYRMLVYAVVLILVMIFTNNPTTRAIFNRLFSPVRKLFHKEQKEPVEGGETK